MTVERKFELTCGHCKAVFIGNYKRHWKHQRGSPTYCADACRLAASSQKAQAQAVREGKTLRKGVLAGPCKKCGGMFESRIDKQFCSLDCYIASDQFREMQSQYWAPSDAVKAKIAETLRTGGTVPCLECGEHFYRKQSDATRRKFCTKACYRSYMAKRFDRWVASPESMALPQCYDEFLDRDRLRCVVHGCDWEGLHLTTHMNQAHGLPAADFKRATGFNLSTGVIARPLAQAFQSRARRGVAVNQPDAESIALAHAAQSDDSYIRYVSREACEHQKKARALLGSGPTRTCKGCASYFVQSTPMGRALYCSVECRTYDYAKKASAQRKNASHAEAP